MKHAHWASILQTSPSAIARRASIHAGSSVVQGRLPNGAWCLFRANPTGTREGKVVVAQHRSIEDPELGGRYTVKVYSSEKVAAEDGELSHRRIVLRPDSDRPGFKPIVLDADDHDGVVAVVAEFLIVLPGT